jgi:hypothetical protein
MGLDHWLSVSRRESNYNFEVDQRGENDVYNKIVEITGLDKDKLDDKGFPVVRIEWTPVVWRKSNQIHGWFVNNLGDGVDECQEMYVPRAALVELKGICKTLLVKKERNANEANELAAELLPPMEGFFFGAYNIDEWYWGDIQYTYDAISDLLNEIPDDSWKYRITYQASW